MNVFCEESKQRAKNIQTDAAFNISLDFIIPQKPEFFSPSLSL